MRICILFSVFIAVVQAAILGLDYGQQFTKAVLLAPGTPFEMVLTDEGKRKDLSGISIRSSRVDELERVYGSSTGSLCTRFPESCITGIKPLLGKAITDSDVSDYLDQHLGVKLVEDDSRNSIKFDMGFANQSYVFSTEEIFAMNLQNIKARAIKALETNSVAVALAEDVVISIPPFATQETRQAYIDALQLGGFSNILGLVEEGTAVALNYLSNKKIETYNSEREYHLVYDMGAGSTKVTLFSFVPYVNGSLELKIHNVGFDESFGGNLLTNSIYTILVEKFLMKFNLKHANLSKKISARIMEVSEKAKIILSANSDYHVSLESIFDDKDFKTTVSRQEFEEINSDMMTRITTPILKALNGSNISEIKSVILNGGSTRVPFVQSHLNAFVGENKISKTVNTDESCALGTTLRGLKLKTQFEKANEIKVIESSYHNYQVFIDDSDKGQVVFEKGDIVDTTKALNISTFSKDMNINLYEDDKFFKSYKFEDLKKKSDKLACKNQQALLNFKLDHNKMFDLSSFQIECVKEEKSGFFKNLLKKGDNEDEESVAAKDEFQNEEFSKNSSDSTNSDTAFNSTNNSSSKKKISRPISIHIPKPSYGKVKPISRISKQKLVEKLSYLNEKDQEKIHLDYIKNILEAKCYELRSFIDENEKILHSQISDLESYGVFVSDTIEWLEFESDSCTAEEFEKKISEVAKFKAYLERVIKITNTDLSKDGLTKFYEEASSIVMKIQSKMLEFGREISDIRQKFETEGFDFDKENDRIKVQLMSKKEDKILTLDRSLAKYKEDVTRLGEIVNLSDQKFTEVEEEILFLAYDSIADQVILMLNDLELVENSHQERLSLFNAKFNTLLERRKQKEFREKLKLEKEAYKKLKNEDEDEEQGEQVEQDRIFFEEEGEQTSTINSADEKTIIEDLKSKTISSEKLEETEAIHDEL